MYSYTTRVRYSEISENENAGILSVINYFQDCCTFESEDKGIGIEWLNEHKTVWMLTGWQIKVDRFPRYCEHIRVSTWACGFKFFVGKRNFTIVNEETGELLVYAYSDWAYMNTETGLPEKNVPQKELDEYGISEPLDKEFERGKLRLPAMDEMKPGEPVKVTRQYIDTNHHVNNEQYVKIAMTCIPDELIEGFEGLRSFRAEYKQQSVLGDVLYPFVKVDDREETGSKVITVVLRDDTESVRLISEFII